MARNPTDVASARDLDLFLEMMGAERGAAENTLRSYERDLVDFLTFVHGRKRTARSVEAR